MSGFGCRFGPVDRLPFCLSFSLSPSFSLFLAGHFVRRLGEDNLCPGILHTLVIAEQQQKPARKPKREAEVEAEVEVEAGVFYFYFSAHSAAVAVAVAATVAATAATSALCGCIT